MIQSIIDSFSGFSIMALMVGSTLLMYFYLQPILFIIYICFLISIPMQEDQKKRFKVIIILNKILWWTSLFPFLCLFIMFFAYRHEFFGNSEYWVYFVPPILTWEAVSLYWLTGFFLFLFYKKARKLIPIIWYKLGLWFYGLIFLSSIVLLTMVEIQST